MRLLAYHFLLAAKSLRRDAPVSLIMLVALSVGAGIWSLTVSEFTRFNGYEIHLRPTLHQVEILRPHDRNSAFTDGARTNPYMVPTSILSRTQISYGEYQALLRSQAPAQQSAGIRAEVLVRGGGAAAADVRVARFTDAAFFRLFERPFAVGGPWSSAADAGGMGVVVLGFATGRSLFPRGDAFGRVVLVEGLPFRVVGVLSQYQPLNAPWQLLMTGGFEDALFLPMGEFNRLAVRPDEPIFRAPVAAGREALLASETLFVTLWVDLPTAGARAAYTRDLDRLLGPGRYRLRSLAQWRRDLGMPASPIAFFSFIGAVVLLGGGFNLSRWLLTKGLARGAELGVYRALGAPRASLFWRTIAEASLLAAPAALLAPVMALPIFWLHNRYIHLVDMPLQMGSIALVASIVPTFVVCVLGATYPAWRLAHTRPTIWLGRP